ncbi:MAG: uracil-DNA glycosylase [Neptuniibacter sp.]
MKELDPFFRLLQKRKNTLTVFNPYRDEIKLNNLKSYLDLIFQQEGPRVLLVGEAPGFKGCRLTGIPFSSGKLFDEVPHPFLEALKPRIYIEQLDSENTASIVWRHLLNHNSVPLFWNSFPFHPHPSRIQKKNRAPNKAEIEEGAIYLQMLFDFYKPDLVAGLGRKGTECVQRIMSNESIRYIRHPSYGGKAEFCSGIDDIFSSFNPSQN